MAKTHAGLYLSLRLRNLLQVIIVRVTKTAASHADLDCEKITPKELTMVIVSQKAILVQDRIRLAGPPRNSLWSKIRLEKSH
jgi:hypothetical protein